MNDKKTDGGADVPCISLFGVGDEVPDRGSVLCVNGVISLSYGLCEEIKRKAPGVRGFKVQVILTPNAEAHASATKEPIA